MSSSHPKPARPRILSTRLAFAIHCLIAVAIVVLANIIVSKHPQTWDLSANQDLTLADQSINVLENLNQDIRVVVAVRRDHPLREKVYDLAAAADKINNDRINLDEIDPVREPNETAELVEMINGKLTAASTPESPLPPFTLDGDKVLIISGDVIEQIDINDMVQEEAMPQGGVTRLFRGEELFTAAILAATQAEPDIIGLISGLGEAPGGLRGPSMIASAMGYQNAQLLPLNLDNAQEIPAQVKALLFYGPQSDLSEHSAELVIKYWSERQGGLAYFLEPGTTNKLQRLLAVPRAHGIFPEENRVVRVTPGLEEARIEYSLTSPLSVIAPWNPEWQRLQRSSTALSQGELESRAMRLAENPDQIAVYLPPTSLSLRLDYQLLRQREGRASLTNLLQAPEGYWGETNSQESPPTLDPNSDHIGPLTIAAGIDVDPKSVEEGNRAGRMVVVGNANLLADQNVSQSNFDFTINALNWVMARENLIGIAPKRPEMFAFTLDDRTNTRVQLVYLGLIPAALLSLALFVYQLRRK